MEHGWQRNQRVTVPHGGSIAVPLPPSRPVLDRLTIWAVSGARAVTNMTFQPRLNGVNFGASTNVAAVRAAVTIFTEGGATQEDRLFPVGKGTLTAPFVNPDSLVLGPDPFDFDVNISNAGANDEDITLYFVAVGRDGGAA